MARTRDDRFIPALRFGALTGLFDPLMSMTRHARVFRERVLGRAAIQEGEHVLDLACGTGTLAVAAARAVPGAHITGVDGDAAILERARAKAQKAAVEVRFDEGLSTELPYPDASFDVALSTLFFHHLGNDAKRRSGEELQRVLRLGGRVVIGDVGRPQGPVMRLAVLPVQLLDGFDVTGGNVAGRLPELLFQAGFSEVRVTDRMRTPLGTLEVLAAHAAQPGGRP